MRKRLFLALCLALTLVAALFSVGTPASAAGGKAGPCVVDWASWDMSIEVPSGQWISIQIPMVAETDQFVQDWMSASEVGMTLDGQSLPWEYQFFSWENTEVIDYGDGIVIWPGTYPGFNPTALHHPLRVGMHTVELSWTLSQEVSDGWFTYDPGLLAETEITVTVTPADEYPSDPEAAVC